MLCQVMSGYARLVQVEPVYYMTVQVRSG